MQRIVQKFGGTSVGSVENMTNVKNIIKTSGKKVVVLSAMSGTTNALVALSENVRNNEIKEGNKSLDELYIKYNKTISELLNQSSLSQEVGNYIDSVFDFLRSCLNESYSELLYNQIVSQGELLSTFIFSRFLTQEGLNARLLPALDFMRIDRNKEPDNFYIAQNLNRAIDEMLPADIYITQGFICLDADGKISNLERGGSDYTATIIGAVINADEVQIWKKHDVSGVLWHINYK